jgi:hypothetical protein
MPEISTGHQQPTRRGIGYKWNCNRFVGKVLRQCPAVLVLWGGELSWLVKKALFRQHLNLFAAKHQNPLTRCSRIGKISLVGRHPSNHPYINNLPQNVQVGHV